MSIAVLSYLGFDAIASFAEETAGDSRQVGSAILFCLGAAGVLFVAQSYLAGVLSADGPADLAAQPGSAGHGVLRPHASGDCAVAGDGARRHQGDRAGVRRDDGQAAAARLLFGMARDGRLPTALAAVDRATACRASRC